MSRIAENRISKFPDAVTTNASDKRTFFQPKLSVNEPGDIYEREADTMADKVMRMKAPSSQSFFKSAPTLLQRKHHGAGELDDEELHRKETPSIQRKCKHCEEEDKMLQRKENANTQARDSAGLTRYVDSLDKSGEPLSDSSRSFFEPRFGYDFSDVRVHTDDSAARSARSINALAYTAGNHIVFNQGQYTPDDEAGQKLMAHELTHVIQQGGDVKMINRQGGAVAEAAPEPAPEINWETEPANDNAPGGAANDNAAPFGRQSQPIRMPSPNDHSGWATIERGIAITNAENNAQYWKERIQIDTFIETGSPPDFITERSIYINQIGGRNNFRAGKVLHFIPKIKYDFEQAQDFAALAKVYSQYSVWLRSREEMEKDVCKQNPDFDLVIDEKFLRSISLAYILPSTNEEIYKIRHTITTAAADRYAKIKERVKQQAIGKELAIAEATTLKEKRKSQGPCSLKVVPAIGGNSRHNRFAAHVASVKGYGRVKGELEYTTPENIKYSFDTYNPANKRDVWEVKTRHEWLSDHSMSKGDYLRGGFDTRFIGLEAQRLRGLYVASRCGLNFKYAFDNCGAVLGIRKQWIIPPIEYIPYPGDAPEDCHE